MEGDGQGGAEHVVLVDARDREIGTAEKLSAHREGRLHRAVSVFVLDDGGRVLLQRRATSKYHSGGRWSNSCCGHPRPGELAVDAARRRLREEMGIDCVLEHAATFTYRAAVGGGLIENELDHIFRGRVSGDPSPDPGEVEAWRWASPREIASELAARPESYTVWFQPAWEALARAAHAPDG